MSSSDFFLKPRRTSTVAPDVIPALGHARRGLAASVGTLERSASRTAEATTPRDVTDRVSLSGEAPLVTATVERVSSQASFSANLKVVQTAEDMIGELLKDRRD